MNDETKTPLRLRGGAGEGLLLPGWNPPSATIDGQHWFPAGSSESGCGTVFYSAPRVSEPDRSGKHRVCIRCAKAQQQREGK